jgi:hypothetical protein
MGKNVVTFFNYFPSPSLEEEGEVSFVILSNARKLPCG